jgi:hypothetical protein
MPAAWSGNIDFGSSAQNTRAETAPAVDFLPPLEDRLRNVSSHLANSSDPMGNEQPQPALIGGDQVFPASYYS